MAALFHKLKNFCSIPFHIPPRDLYNIIYDSSTCTLVCGINGTISNWTPAIKYQQYIWTAPQCTNSAALFVLIISAPNDFYNQGSIHQCD
ncbi:MAG: hypothetical protein EZS28_054931, partial [Streblomastix strix]